MTEVVERYKDSKAIAYWQVENEPLFKFGNARLGIIKMIIF